MERLVRAEIEHVDADIKVLSELIGRVKGEHDVATMLNTFLLHIEGHKNCVANLIVLVDGEAWGAAYIGQLISAQHALGRLEEQAQSLSIRETRVGKTNAQRDISSIRLVSSS